MARTLNPEAHARRRQAFLDVAACVIERKGYEGMTIQDVLNGMQTSKGAFYHYFESKEALLLGLVEQLAEVSLARVEAGMRDPDRTASEKLRRMFVEEGQRKLEQKGLVLALIKPLYAEDNAVIRQRVESRVRGRMGELLGRVVAQGVDEGIFTTPYPDEVGRQLFALLRDFQDCLMELWLEMRTAAFDRMRIERAVAAYDEALARLLGVSTTGAALIDVAQIPSWFEGSDERTERERQLTVAHGWPGTRENTA